PGDLHKTPVRRAFIDLRRRQIRSKFRRLRVQQAGDVRVVAVGGIEVQRAPDPGTGVDAVIAGFGKKTLVVIRVHDVRELQLFEVAQTLYAMRLGFGFGEGGQKNAGQNSNDGDYHQKLDQDKNQPSSAIRARALNTPILVEVKRIANLDTAQRAETGVQLKEG